MTLVRMPARDLKRREENLSEATSPCAPSLQEIFGACFTGCSLHNSRYIRFLTQDHALIAPHESLVQVFSNLNTP